MRKRNRNRIHLRLKGYNLQHIAKIGCFASNQTRLAS